MLFVMRSIGRGWILLLFVSATAVADTDSTTRTVTLIEEPPTEIIGGTADTVGQFPTVVVLEIGNSLCSGTIIDKDWVVTAAHCMDPSVLGLSSQAAVTSATRVHSG